MEDNINIKRHLKLLSKQYTNIEQVSEEIINLQAILNLPKGTELFLSDIHGEYGSFSHILNNGSGIIKNKIEDIFDKQITEHERSALATLIYYPEEKLALIKRETKDINEWYSITLYRLIEVAREVSSKYTRSKVRKAMPKGFDYIIDELLHLQGCGPDKETYYKQIISSIIELDRADEFIVAISNLIKRMAIDHLHVLGDIFDRGPNAKLVIDTLMKFHSLDIELGNHDVLWMGAACGNRACIANVIRICSRYDNINTLEEGYGINIRPLTTFALETYTDDDCTKFLPKVFDYNKYIRSDEISIAKLHKAISIIQIKLEGQLIMKHPEYEMDGRLFLDKIDYKNGTVEIAGKTYELNDTNFPTIDPKDPYKLTREEEEIISRLEESFKNSETLNKHIAFLYSKSSIYKCFNSNLLFHGCIPMDEDGEFTKVDILGRTLAGKEYLDFIDKTIRIAYFEREQIDRNEDINDLMWYLWCGPKSPLFGKEKAATFERYFVIDKETHEEKKNAYFTLSQHEEICDKILKEFGLEGKNSHIINGHIPVKEKDGESPIRANGKLLVIDGGFAKSYRSQTGRAGYTLTYNSYGLILAANEPFDSKADAIREEIDIKYDIMVNEKETERKNVADTDIGKQLQEEIDDLKLLLQAYKEGKIKQQI
ncbi:MAG: fructose-1,6-bisphosphatase [Clostridia bacterium]|nr:fructose-1,6-bisphosphatase [Clostridia bacterium]